MALRPRVGAGDDEAPVGVLRERGPDLLSVHVPAVVAQYGRGANSGEVTAGAGLGVTLAPDVGAVQDAGQEPVLLLLRAERRDRRAGELLTEVVDPAGRAGPRVLLVEDDLLRHRRTATAGLARPPESDPAGPAELPLPLLAQLDVLVLPARSAGADEHRELSGQVLGQPAAHLVAEVLEGAHPP